MDVAPDSKLFMASIYAPSTGYVDQPIQFYSEYDDILQLTSSPYNYSWYFPDQDLMMTEQNVVHTFKETGQYIVTLNISDSTGYVAKDKHIITIEKDEKSPLVSFTKPRNAFYLWNHKILSFSEAEPLILGDLDIIVDARDYESGVKHVDFFIDGSLMYSDVAEPYVYRWDAKRSLTFKEQHILGVLVEDYAGNQIYSEITVWRFFS